MKSLITPSPALTCSYSNPSDRVQVARVTGLQGFLLERVVFPGQRFTFEAGPEASLEVYSAGMASALLEDRLSCQKLQVDPPMKKVEPLAIALS